MVLVATVNPLRYFAMDRAGMDMKQLRLRVKLRTVDVASRVGVGESSVRNWEKGRTMPKLTIDKTAALCLLYQCSIEELAQSVQESILQADVNLDLGEVSDSPEVE
jgi:putative transcriptional regulator